MIQEENKVRYEIALRILPEILKQGKYLPGEYRGCENVLTSHCYLSFKIADEFIRVSKAFNK